jgi:hypothetical protein
MTFADFSRSLRDDQPPATATPALRALWYDGRGDWPAAHAVAQELETAQGSLIHAYLHRKERDLDNARTWYRRAGRTIATASLPDEWKALVEEMLAAAITR